MRLAITDSERPALNSEISRSSKGYWVLILAVGLACLALVSLPQAVPVLQRIAGIMSSITQRFRKPTSERFATERGEQFDWCRECTARIVDRTARFQSVGDTREDEIGRVASKRDAIDTEPLHSRVRVLPEEIDGLKQLIEDPGGKSLSPFYRDLMRTAQGQAGAITRIAHYGDSAVAYDHIASSLRRRLQQRFGDAGHGFILIARGDMHYMHRDIHHRSSRSWKLFSMVHKSLGLDWYGYGGVQYQSTPGSSARFATVRKGPIGLSVSRFEIFYQRYRRGGDIKIRIDGQKRGVLRTRSRTRTDAWEAIDLPDGPHSLTIRAGRGVARLYGVVLERAVPGVVYDSLGMVGGQVHRLLNAEPEHMKRQIEHRNPSLIILGFGGNEACNSWLNLDNYERDLHRVVQIVRGQNHYPCLLFGPLDQGELNKRGREQTIEKVNQIIAVQRRVARERQCAYFDTFSAMGGERSIWRWYKKKPSLATADFKHATPAGYDVIGEMFYKALLKGFADFLKQDR